MPCLDSMLVILTRYGGKHYVFGRKIHTSNDFITLSVFLDTNIDTSYTLVLSIKASLYKIQSAYVELVGTAIM